MGVGQIISDTFGMVKERFGSLLGLWAVYFGIMILLMFVFAMVLGAVGMAGFAAMGAGDSLTEGGAMALGTGMVVSLILFYLVYILVAMAQYASLIMVASPLRQVNFGDAFGAGWRAAPAMLLLMVVLGIGYFAVAMVLSLLAAALGDASAVLLLLVVPVAVWLGCRLAPLFGVMAVDGVRNPFTAIARSWRLTSGHALTIFLAMLVIVVLLIVVCGVALLPSLGLIASMSDPTSVADVGSAMGGFALLMLGILVASALFTIIYSAFQAVIHGTLANAAGEGVVEAFA